MPGSFFDTNVLVYLASSDPAKANRAETIVSDGGTVSVQILNELANVARRKMRLSWPDTRTFLSTIRGLLLVTPITVEIHENGLALAERYSLSIYDAMIVAAALHADCGVLWSEDMQDGMEIEKRLRVAAAGRTRRTGPAADRTAPPRSPAAAHEITGGVRLRA